MTILDRAKEAADEYARDIGGTWVVLGNPKHVQRFTKMRDVCITGAEEADGYMIPGDAVLYSTAA